MKPALSEARAETAEPRAETKGIPKAPRLDERAWAEAYRTENGITKAAMARMIGYSRTAYAEWEDGTYEGDAEQVAAAIRAMRDRIEGPGGLSSVVGFRETRTVKKVLQAYELACAGELVILIGDSGVGKSEALKEIKRRASKAGKGVPIYLEATVFTSAFALVMALGEQVGLGRRPNPDMLLRDIAGKLRRTPRVILLDEAHYAHERAIEALRQIRDQSGAGVLIAGTSTLAGLAYGALGQSDILQDLLRHRPHLEQVVRRAIIWEVKGLESDEVEGIAHEVLGHLTETGLERLSLHVGHSMGRLVRLLLQIRDVRGMKKRSGPVDEADVNLAWARMYGGRNGARR